MVLEEVWRRTAYVQHIFGYLTAACTVRRTRKRIFHEFQFPFILHQSRKGGGGGGGIKRGKKSSFSPPLQGEKREGKEGRKALFPRALEFRRRPRSLFKLFPSLSASVGKNFALAPPPLPPPQTNELKNTSHTLTNER